MQSKIALGSGGFFGKGIFNGTQSKLGFVPEHSTDFILTAFGEEFGFFGVLILMTLYLFVALRGLSISVKALTEILNPRKATKRYNVINIRTPKNPNSSPNAVKIKSVECSGTKPSFDWVPLKIPLPKNPPDPRAILDCIK